MSQHKRNLWRYASLGLLVLGVGWFSSPASTPSITDDAQAVDGTSNVPVVIKGDIFTSPAAPIGSSARKKSFVLSEALEQRPPALTDRHTTGFSEPLRQQRYAARASRAERLNQRLTQRIEDFTTKLESATPEERPRLELELTELRENLAKRQALERATYPMPNQRPALD